MGGHLFNTKRLESTKYFFLCSGVESKLKELFGRVVLVRAFLSKKDYGDGDFICSDVFDTYAPITEQLKNKFNLSDAEIKPNSNIISFKINEFQIDVIITKSKYFETSSFYYFDSPAGNGIGKGCHSIGISLGFDGLYHTLRDENNTYKLGKIQISTNPEKICGFLGLDYQKKLKGFETEEEIFDWIISGKYFNARLFSFDSMTHRARVRDRKRPDYNRLLSYIEKFPQITYDRPSRKEDNLPYINSYFPEANLIEEITKLKEKRAKVVELSLKFNGNLIMEWLPNLAGKELGAVLGAYKQDKDWLNWLDSYSAAEIKIDFLEFYSKSKV